MFSLFRAQAAPSPPGAGTATMAAERPPEVSRYLTDGLELYRFLGPVAHGAGEELVAIENCRSLDVMLVPVGDLQGAQLRSVTLALPG
jgi:hypothetical protein